MAAKTVTISARIPHEDAEFIGRLQLEGATTPSDKLRAIIDEVRRHREGKQDYPGCMTRVQELISPVSSNIRVQEHLRNTHSEMVTRVLDWLPDTMAFIMSSANPEGDGNTDLLQRLEEGLADRIFRLMESMLQMGVTPRSPCYNDKAIQERIGPILDLTRVIGMIHQQAEEK